MRCRGAQVNAAAQMIEDLLVPTDEARNEHKRLQLQELAALNGARACCCRPPWVAMLQTALQSLTFPYAQQLPYTVTLWCKEATQCESPCAMGSIAHL